MFDSLYDQLPDENRLEQMGEICNHLNQILEAIEQSELRKGADRNKAIDAIISILAQHKKFDPISLTKIQSCCC